MLALAKSDLVRAHWQDSIRGEKMQTDYIILLPAPVSKSKQIT